MPPTGGSFDCSLFLKEEAIFHQPFKFPGCSHHGGTILTNYQSWSSLGMGGASSACGKVSSLSENAECTLVIWRQLSQKPVSHL